MTNIPHFERSGCFASFEQHLETTSRMLRAAGLRRATSRAYAHVRAMSSFDPRGVWTAVVTPFAPDGAVDWRAYEALVQAQVDAGVAGVIAVRGTMWWECADCVAAGFGVTVARPRPFPMGTTRFPMLPRRRRRAPRARASRSQKLKSTNSLRPLCRSLVAGAGSSQEQVRAVVAGPRVAPGILGTACLCSADVTNTVVAAAFANAGSNSTADAVEATSAAKAAGVDACMLVNPYYNRPTQAGLIAHVKAVASVGLPIVLYNNVGRSAVNMLPATVAE